MNKVGAATFQVKIKILFVCVLTLYPGGYDPEGHVIPPMWANDTLNQCAKKSWQLLHWPPDGLCYYIFSQGPCGKTQELFFDRKFGKASCRCERGTLWHSETQRCYARFSSGPCSYREYFEVETKTTKSDEGVCHKYESCPPGHLFWPPTGQCFPHLSKGPCLEGHLLYHDPKSGSTLCGCQIDLMSTNYWVHEETCHELYTQGPCIYGHIFIYNLNGSVTECVCGPHLSTNYHQETGRCYELDKPGPCLIGQVFTYDKILNEARCSCLPEYVKWTPSGECYRSYTRGPCKYGEFIQPSTLKQEIGTCRKNTCTLGQLLEPISEECYYVGKRGPCNWGQLWVFEKASSVRGTCKCDTDLVGYWAPHNMCYELGTTGPCPKRQVLSYDRNTRLLNCRCDRRRRYVPWVSGLCIKSGIQKKKLIPVADLKGITKNNIQYTRVHRGLTLPFLEKGSPPNTSEFSHLNHLPLSPKLQEHILEDILSTIFQRNVSNITSIHNANKENKEINATESVESNLRRKQKKQSELKNMMTQTETSILRITMSKSETRIKGKWTNNPPNTSSARVTYSSS